MTKSTSRTALPRAAALLIALALALGWSESGSVLAHARVESVGQLSGAPLLADPRVESAGQVTPGSDSDTGDGAKDIRALSPAHSAPLVASAPVAAPKPKPEAPKATVASKPTYAGRNRFWIPSLGMNDRVYSFACTRSRDPDNLIYRWGCAGTNNVYILGHAYGVMKPLHDLYVRGGLRTGMVAIYADSAGVVHWYRVVSWRVVDPTQAAWAIASQPVPSMTLQTCVGATGSLRLNVRLVQFKVT